MSFTLKDIKGAVVEKKYCANHPDNGHWNFPKGHTNKEFLHCEFCEIFHIHNCTIDAQSSVPIRFNREKLSDLLYEKEQEFLGLQRNERPTKNIYDFIADAIIAADKDIVEVVND